MPFGRFRLRTLMIAVAVAALLLAAKLARERSVVYRERSFVAECFARAIDFSLAGAEMRGDAIAAAKHREAQRYYLRLAAKYRRAARFPWLPVPPDPPPPEWPPVIAPSGG